MISFFRRIAQRQVLFLERGAASVNARVVECPHCAKQLVLNEKDPNYGKGARVKFTSQRDALEFLRELTKGASNMESLRQVFSKELASPTLFDRANEEVLEQIAWRLWMGLLSVTVVELPQHPFHGGALKAKAKPEKGKAKEDKHKPGPIVPIEYIILARRQSNAMSNETRKINNRVNNEKHLVYKAIPRKSALSPEFQSVAGITGNKIRDAVANIEGRLNGQRYRGFKPLKRVSLVSDTCPHIAEQWASGVRRTTTDTQVEIGRLTDWMLKQLRPESALAREAMGEGGRLGALAAKDSALYADAMAAWLFQQGLGPEPANSRLAAMALEAALVQGKTVGGSIFWMAQGLDGVAFKEALPVSIPGSTLAAAALDNANLQTGLVVDGIGGMSVALGDAQFKGIELGGIPESKLALEGPYGALLVGEATRNSVNGFGVGLDGLVNGPVGDGGKIEDSQLSGMTLNLAGDQYRVIGPAVTGIGDELGVAKFVEAEGRPLPESKVAGAALGIAGDQSVLIRRSVDGLGIAVEGARMSGGTNLTLPESDAAREQLLLSGQQAKGTSGAILGIGDDVRKLQGSEGMALPPIPDSQIGDEAARLGAMQGREASLALGGVGFQLETMNKGVDQAVLPPVGSNLALEQMSLSGENAKLTGQALAGMGAELKKQEFGGAVNITPVSGEVPPALVELAGIHAKTGFDALTVLARIADVLLAQSDFSARLGTVLPSAELIDVRAILGVAKL